VQTYNFNRSFVTFVTRDFANQARIQIEAICHLTDQLQGTTESFYLVASCKGEDTYGSGVLFYEPNYDFSAIFSATDYFIMRVGVPHGSKQNSIGCSADFFEEVRIAPHEVEGDTLANHEAIVRATLANRPLNGHTKIVDPGGRYHATLVYPIKTINANDRRNIYQVDTGPILFASKHERIIERFELAYVAYNQAAEAYFVIQEPIPVIANQPDAPKVSHYARIVGQGAKNQVVAL
jgi:hypothetical protein